MAENIIRMDEVFGFLFGIPLVLTLNNFTIEFIREEKEREDYIAKLINYEGFNHFRSFCINLMDWYDFLVKYRQIYGNEKPYLWFENAVQLRNFLAIPHPIVFCGPESVEGGLARK